MKLNPISLGLVLLPVLAACSNPPVQSPTPEPTYTASVPGLTLEQLGNTNVHLPFYDRDVTLVNGEYRYESGPEVLRVRLMDVHAFGDLNGDGVPDAAVLLVENGGGSGNFESLNVFYNDNGSPLQVGEVTLGDRVLVRSITIQRTEILLDMVVHGPNDPLCCPSFPTQQTYRMIGGHLWMTNLISSLTDGTQRVISITSPGIGEDVSSPFTITGSVSIAPFEATLACRVYLPDGTLVNESPLMVDAPDLGAPGTFSHIIDLSSAGIHGLVIIQFVDVSMADGSTLALGSAVVNLP
jgi:hypothetical protein